MPQKTAKHPEKDKKYVKRHVKPIEKLVGEEVLMV